MLVVQTDYDAERKGLKKTFYYKNIIGSTNQYKQYKLKTIVKITYCLQ